MRVGTLALAVGVLAPAGPAVRAQAPTTIQAAVDAAVAKYKGLKDGSNAD